MARTSKNMHPGCLKAFLAIFVFAGLVMTFFGTKDIYDKYVRAERMVPVDVTITDSRVSTSSSSKGGTSHSFEVEFTYQVAGNTYTGDSYRVGINSSDSYDECEALTNKYQVGSVHKGFYDPDSPEFSALTTEPDLSWLFVLGMGLVFCFFPLLIFKLAKRTEQKELERKGRKIGQVGLPKSQSKPTFGIVISLVFIVFPVVFAYLTRADASIGRIVFFCLFGLIGLGLLVASISGIPGYRALMQTYIAFSKPSFSLGDSVQLILFDPAGMIDSTRVKLALAARRLGSKGQPFFEDISPVVFEAMEAEDKPAIVGSVEIPEMLGGMGNFVLPEADIPELVIKVSYRGSKAQYDLPFDGKPLQANDGELQMQEQGSESGL